MVSSLWGDIKYLCQFMSALTVLEIAVCDPFLSEKLEKMWGEQETLA